MNMKLNLHEMKCKMLTIKKTMHLKMIDKDTQKAKKKLPLPV